MDHMNFGRTMHGGIVLVKELWIKLGEQFAKIDLAKKKRHTTSGGVVSHTQNTSLSSLPSLHSGIVQIAREHIYIGK